MFKLILIACLLKQVMQYFTLLIMKQLYTFCLDSAWNILSYDKNFSFCL